MTTKEFVKEQTKNALNLEVDEPKDDYILKNNEYYALMLIQDSLFNIYPLSGYLSNYHETLKIQDLGIAHSSMNNTPYEGYYITKDKNKIKRNAINSSRIVIVTINDLSKCMIL